MLIYFDNGIIASIEKGELVLENILAALGCTKNNAFLPFTAAHIQEANNITHPNEMERQKYLQNRLQLIREISDGYYLNFVMEVGKIKEFVKEPSEVLATITEIPIADTAMKMFVNLFSKEQRSQIRKILGIESTELNNYDPLEVVEHLNTKLTALGSQSFIDLIEYGMMSNHTSILGHRFFMGEKVAIIFDLLDMLGYWKDKQTETSNYARLWDANHVSYAAYCDYFISNDLRARKKAQVVYSLLEIKTKILSSDAQP